MAHPRILDKDGSYNDYNSILDPMLTLNIQTPQVPGEITLTWSDCVTGEQGWRVQRSTDGENFNWYKNLPADSTSWTDTNLPDETVYYYRIRAYGNDVDTAYSAKHSALTTLHEATYAKAESVSNTKVRVSWVDNSDMERGYHIYRSSTSDGTYTLVGSLANDAQEYTDTGLSTTQRYYYKVEAYVGAHVSEQTQQVSALAALPAASNVLASNNGTGIDVKWSVPSSGDYNGYTVTVTDPQTNAVVATVPVSDPAQHTCSVANVLPSSGVPPEFDVRVQTNAIDGPGPESPPTKNWTESTDPNNYMPYVYELGNPSSLDPEPFVISTWKDSNGSVVVPSQPLYAGIYKLELSNLPRHLWAHIDMRLDGSGPGWDTGSALSVSAGAESLYMTTSKYQGANYWYPRIAPDKGDATDAFQHNDAKMTITIDASTLPAGWSFNVALAQVWVSMPHVTLITENAVGYEGTPTDAKLKAVRTGTSTMLQTPLTVQLDQSTPEGDLPATGFSFDGSITIPSGLSSYVEPLGITDDANPEWTEFVAYSLSSADGYISTSTDEHILHIVDDDLGISDPPATMIRNDDDDNGDMIPDDETNEDYGVDGEDDLHEIHINFPREYREGATVSISAPSFVHLWLNSNRTGPLGSSHEWTESDGKLPPTALYAEAGGMGGGSFGAGANDHRGTSTTATSQPTTAKQEPKIIAQKANNQELQGTGWGAYNYNWHFDVRGLDPAAPIILIQSMSCKMDVNFGQGGHANAGSDYTEVLGIVRPGEDHISIVGNTAVILTTLAPQQEGDATELIPNGALAGLGGGRNDVDDYWSYAGVNTVSFGQIDQAGTVFAYKFTRGVEKALLGATQGTTQTQSGNWGNQSPGWSPGTLFSFTESPQQLLGNPIATSQPYTRLLTVTWDPDHRQGKPKPNYGN